MYLYLYLAIMELNVPSLTLSVLLPVETFQVSFYRAERGLLYDPAVTSQ